MKTKATVLSLVLLATAPFLGTTDTLNLAANDPTQASASVFTVQRNNEVKPGCVDSKPNDQSIDMSVVEFHDDGSFAKPGQLEAALSCISHARKENKNGAVVVLLIHGWHHSAAWDTTTNTGDAHFGEFRKILMGLALREAERYTPEGAAGGRRVVGVYFGWNGDPKNSMLHRINENLSFWNRYEVAVRIADSTNIQKALGEIIDRTKEKLNTGDTHGSPLIMIGHSMGGLILETAFLGLLSQNSKHAAAGGSSSCTAVERGDQPATFPDVLLLLNSAADSRVASNIATQIDKQRIRKFVGCGPTRFRAPLLIYATSDGDTATKLWFPRAKAGHKTAANTQKMLTHRLVRDQSGAVCTPKSSSHIMVDYNQSWHCLRQPLIQNGSLAAVAIDLPQEIDLRNSCHVRYRLEPIGAEGNEHPLWIFQVPQSIIKDHNDIFNQRSNLFIMALTQMSGAVMSLAYDWTDTFEMEEGTCPLLP